MDDVLPALVEKHYPKAKLVEYARRGTVHQGWVRVVPSGVSTCYLVRVGLKSTAYHTFGYLSLELFRGQRRVLQVSYLNPWLFFRDKTALACDRVDLFRPDSLSMICERLEFRAMRHLIVYGLKQEHIGRRFKPPRRSVAD